MPSKSRRDRRRLPGNTQAGVSSGSIPVVTSAAAVTGPAQPAKKYFQPKGPPPDPAQNMKYLGQELKWIGVVTLVIVILMIISYYIFR